MKRNLIYFTIEGFILSFLNLAFMAIVNYRHYGYGDVFFGVYEESIEEWYFSLAFFSFVISFLYMKLKKLTKKKKWILSVVYTIVTMIVDYSFRSCGDIKIAENILLWMFILIIVVWIVFRYEVDELIK